MPGTAEHRADMFALVQERQRAGLPVWDRKLSFRGLFHNDSLTFEQSRDAIVARLRSSAWLTGRDEFDELVCAVEELSEAPSVSDFDQVWDLIYDIADDERVWIETR
jgi:hypothetical protein